MTFFRKKVFISYSWSSKGWVIDFAKKLQGTYGIEVVVDFWSLKPGNDLNAFMEREVNDPTIDKVLMICDKQYMEKANARKGGAGTEAQILSPQLYSQNDPGKYIPIVNMLNSKQQPFLPVFLTSSSFMDFSDESKENESFEKLINDIYDIDTIEKPAIAPIPTKILNHEANDYPLKQIILKIKNNIENPHLIANIFQNDFLRLMELSLQRCEVDKNVQSNNDEVYHKVMKKIDSLNDIENSFKECTQMYLRSGQVDISYLSEYFSNINEYIHNINENTKIKDPIKFILQEQFLIVVGELIRQHQWVNLRYLILFKYKINNGIKSDFTCLQNIPRTICNYNKKKLSPLGLMLKSRNKDIFNQLWCADVLLFYISKIQQHDDFRSSEIWYPVIQTIQTSFGDMSYSPDFPLLENLNIKENMTNLLKLTTVTEKKLKSLEVYQKYTPLQNFTGVPAIKQFQENHNF